jgi:PAS domain S-box-containing protein
MDHKRGASRAGETGLFSLPDSLEDTRHLFAGFSNTPQVGLAVIDDRFRFQAINSSLASMNGLPPEEHLGNTIQDVLGSAAGQLEVPFLHVLETGEPVSNFELRAELPKRSEVGYWTVNYFPLKDTSGRVKQVGAVVLEVTKWRRLEESFRALAGKLLRAEPLLKDSNAMPRASHEAPDLLARSLLENCIAEAHRISHLLQPAGLSNKRRSSPEPISVREAEDVEVAVANLSSRERDVLEFLAEGKTNKEIASVLEISARTVETYRARIMLKLELRSISDLVRYAVRHKIIEA